MIARSRRPEACTRKSEYHTDDASHALRPSADIRGVVLDLDGTLYMGDTPIAGAAHAVSALRSRGLAVVLLTDGSTRNAASICQKLVAMEIGADVADVYTTGTVAARDVAESGFRRALVIGAVSLRDELAGRG